MTRKVNYILDADIKGFFDNLDQKWLMKFLEHDIADKNFLRYIGRFLKAGIMEEGRKLESDRGTPHGGLRYADDFLMMFQYEEEAVKVLELLRTRLAKFGLEVAEDKTRIIPIGRFKGTKEDFDFLGFTFFNTNATYRMLNRRDQKGKFRFSKFLRVWNYYVKEPHLTTDIWNWIPMLV